MIRLHATVLLGILWWELLRQDECESRVLPLFSFPLSLVFIPPLRRKNKQYTLYNYYALPAYTLVSVFLLSFRGYVVLYIYPFIGVDTVCR
jgi:hypothetical protein